MNRIVTRRKKMPFAMRDRKNADKISITNNH